MRMLRLVVFVCAVCAAPPVTHAAGGTEGKPAPAIEAKLLDGAPFALSAETGKVVIVKPRATPQRHCIGFVSRLNRRRGTRAVRAAVGTA
jgi:hypothetical protein